MASTESSATAHPSTGEPTPGYVWRGRGLFETYRETILAGYQGGGRWLVPSGTIAGKVYEVRTGTLPGRSRCECIGFQHHGHCSHLVAAHLSAVCDACGVRAWWPELRQVEADDELLSFYPGDVVCRDCEHEGHWS